MYRVAVVGAGMIANAAHIPAWRDLAGVEIVGVADTREAAARETAQRYAIPNWYVDWRQMLADLAPDIVSVCTPNAYHKEVTLGALQAGAHVLCEKPIATSAADAAQMYQAADQAGKVLLVSQTQRWANSTIAAREMVAAGRLGEIYYAEASLLRRRGVPKWGFFHIKEHNAGGPAYDLGVHFVDALMWIMGNPRPIAVSGMTYCKIADRDEGLVESLAESGAPLGVFTPRPYDYREFDVEDFAVALVRFENGATMVLKTSWAINAPEDVNRVFISGTLGGVQVNPPLLITNMDSYQVNVSPKVLQGRDVPFAGHYGATAHILRVITGQEPLLVRREEVLNVMRILDGLYASAACGAEVRLD